MSIERLSMTLGVARQDTLYIPRWLKLSKFPVQLQANKHIGSRAAEL